eukprot:CAMPEP_0117554294 /NCGR_PEP_ID=MMETSP0784-20121206/50681_1 /TAXON_ID=39447 /ORGANISM="" /LENGTH=209 /DNA_ID=CAMNT_0005351457 /DNA_START=293 /DNA_END=923 /DNA_ORIENTATION=+
MMPNDATKKHHNVSSCVLTRKQTDVAQGTWFYQVPPHESTCKYQARATHNQVAVPEEVVPPPEKVCRRENERLAAVELRHREVVAKVDPQGGAGRKTPIDPAPRIAEGRQTSNTHPYYEVATLDAPSLRRYEFVVTLASEVLPKPYEVARGIGTDARLSSHVTLAVDDVHRPGFAAARSRHALLPHGDVDGNKGLLVRYDDLPALNGRE